jgi:hypothetical protein
MIGSLMPHRGTVQKNLIRTGRVNPKTLRIYMK